MRYFGSTSSSWRTSRDGWIFGGSDGSTVNYNTIEKYTFSNETFSVLSATLTASLHTPTGIANSGVAGYCLGGSTAVNGVSQNAVNTIRKVAFYTESVSTSSSTLLAIRNYGNGAHNANVKGYITWGQSSGALVDTGEQIAFSTDTVSSLTLGGAGSGRRAATPGVYHKTALYLIGGQNPPNTGGIQNAVNKVAMATDSFSSLGAVLDNYWLFGNATSLNNRFVAVYTTGGYGNVTVTAYIGLKKWAYPTETWSTGPSFTNVVGNYKGTVSGTSHGTTLRGGTVTHGVKLVFATETASEVSQASRAAKYYEGTCDNNGYI